MPASACPELQYQTYKKMKKFMSKLKGESADSTKAPAASGPGGQAAGVEDPFAALRRYDTGESM